MQKTVYSTLLLTALFALAGCSDKATEDAKTTLKPGAETALADALAQAKADDKVVFVHLSAPG
jgi:hypothetical protein